jgi:ATP/maltotriose-dependent transcriptional regulator MalT
MFAHSAVTLLNRLRLPIPFHVLRAKIEPNAGPLHPHVAAEPQPASRLRNDDAGHRLTARERELLPLLASGMSNAKLAKTLFISNNTVKTHVRHLLAKLGATNRLEAVARARSLGLLP